MICKPANIALNWGELLFRQMPCQQKTVKCSANDLTVTISADVSALPARWDIIAKSNFFLSRQYLAVLQDAAPANMNCHFIGFYKHNNLCGIALAQYIDLSNINIIPGPKENYSFKDHLLKKYASHIIILGNNTITGQNAFLCSGEISQPEALELLQQSARKLKQQYRQKGIKINMVAIKDFGEDELPEFNKATAGYYRFSTQPNMIFTVRENWHTSENYLADLNTKYRTQYNRARKKAEGIERRQLSAEDIKHHEKRIYELYSTVVDNAGFNTFHLPENHFEVIKQQLGEDFLFCGYFQQDQLIGFSTLIKNEDEYCAYFLGYDAALQKEKMLYLNMLYDMISYTIKQKGKHLKFGRSAMEIKSSVGARAVDVYGFIKHNNALLNPFMARLFPFYEPKTTWKERNPFK